MLSVVTVVSTKPIVSCSTDATAMRTVIVTRTTSNVAFQSKTP